MQHVLTFCCFRCFCGGLGGPTKETPDVLTESTIVQYITLNTHAAQAGSKALVGLEPVAFLLQGTDLEQICVVLVAEQVIQNCSRSV